MFRNMPLGILSKDTGFREKLRLATVGGFEGIDINIEEVTMLSEQHSFDYIRGMLDSFNMKTGAWDLPFSLDAEEKIYSGNFEKLERYARAAKEISAFRVRTVFETDSGKFNFYAERLNPIADILGRYGCRIGIDFAYNPGELQNIDYPGQAAELLKTVKSGNAGIVLNARHWYLSGGNMERLKEITSDRIVYTWIGDVSPEKSEGRYLPGETGVVNLQSFLEVLAEIGYEGPVTPEMPERNLVTLPEEIAVRLLGGSTLRVWNRVFIKKE